jgi:3'-phosphoadenosine 5'-phosphosulfate sulfotransferase (PAPS reductase)/FAD synthetase
MDRVPGYEEIGPPDDAVETPLVEKPEPESDPLSIFEVGVLDTSEVGGGVDRAVLFSGGDDSLALTHMAMEQSWADIVIHLATNSGVPENIDYVRHVCQKYQWPLIILGSPMPLDLFAYRYGFPGSGCHTMAFNYFKGRQLSYFESHRRGDMKFFSGVRRLESDRRMQNIEGEVEYESSSDGGNFDGWWLSPLIDKSDEWVTRYRNIHDLPRNSIAKRLHRSGDCHCLAFGHRDEELTLLQAEYPDFAEWLLNVEQRVQEYRGRVAILEEEYPSIAADVEARREEFEPYPMRLTVLNSAHPSVYEDIVDVGAERAILTGRRDETNYIGHGGLSSAELRSKIASADVCQQTLCETCQGPATSISQSVQRGVQEAEETIGEASNQSRLSSYACGDT